MAASCCVTVRSAFVCGNPILRVAMWEKTFLLFHILEAVVAPPCWQGAPFPGAVVSPAVDSSRLLRVPSVASLSQCVAACCDLSGYDLAWFFKGHCYILSCQQGANYQPQVRPGSNSALAFLQRASPQTLLLQSLVRGEKYGGRWSPGGDLEPMKGLASFDGPRPDFSDPRILDVENSEGGSEAGQPPGGFNQTATEIGSETKQSSVTQINRTSEDMKVYGDENRTRTMDSAAAEETETGSSSVSTALEPATDSAPQHHVTSCHDIITSTANPAGTPPPPPPVAHASGSHVLTLPNNSLVLRGSVTGGDQTQVRYLWTRDSQSPAAGVVLFGSGTQALLYLSDLVEGTYLFQLKVTDALGRSGTATATVEVRPEPGGSEQVELEMLVPVSQVSVAQRDTVVRQLAALIHVLDRDLQVRKLQEQTHLSSILQFSIRGPSGPVSASKLVVLLRKQLLKEKSDFLLFRVLRIDTVVCQMSCSGRGQCDPITKQCVCDPFWTENLVRRYLGDGESNCEWRVLFVVLSSFLLMVSILSLSWTFICCSRRRRRSKVRRRTRYTILDDMDEQERLELRPKFSIKHRSTEHNSSLMMSESDLDSDQGLQPTGLQQEPNQHPGRPQWKCFWMTRHLEGSV